MIEQKEVPLLTKETASRVLAAFRNTDERSENALEAIATGDAATYNTHTHVVVPRGELEALRRDADRYHYLKSQSNEELLSEPDYYQFTSVEAWVGPAPKQHASSLDAAIDAAIAQEKSA